MRVDNLRLKVVALISFTLVCVIAFVYLFTQAGGRLRFSKPYTVSTIVPDALNIVDNADVRMDGIKIGRVRDIQSSGSNSKITFEIEDKDYDQVYRNGSVAIRTKTLVGESYIDLKRGTPDKSKPNDNELPDGGTLPVSRTDEVVPLERILNSFDGPTRASIRRNLDGVGVGLDGHGQDLNAVWPAAADTVADGGKLMKVLKPQERQLAALIEQTGVVTGAIGEREDALRGLATDAKTTAEAVRDRDEQLRSTIKAVPALLQQAQSSVNTLSTFSRKATPVMHDLRLSSVDLAPAIRDLEPVSRDARVLFKELDPFLKKFDPVLEQLSPASDSLRTVVGPLDAFLRQANPAMTYFKPFNKEFGAFFANVGSLVGVKDAYGYKARAYALITQADYTGFTKEQQELLNQLVKAGGLDNAIGIRRNPLPKAGSGQDPNAEQQGGGKYPRVEADK